MFYFTFFQKIAYSDILENRVTLKPLLGVDGPAYAALQTTLLSNEEAQKEQKCDCQSIKGLLLRPILTECYWH